MDNSDRRQCAWGCKQSVGGNQIRLVGLEKSWCWARQAASSQAWHPILVSERQIRASSEGSIRNIRQVNNKSAGPERRSAWLWRLQQKHAKTKCSLTPNQEMRMLINIILSIHTFIIIFYCPSIILKCGSELPCLTLL
jgi:hypothetical protein